MVLELTKMRLKDSHSRIDKYIDRNILQWGKEVILTTAIKNATSAGLSQKAISGIDIVKIGFKKIRLKFEYWGPNHEPLHFFIENDTIPHKIRFKGKIHGGADVLRWFSEMGKPIFRPEVNHPGTTGKHIIKNSWIEAKPHFTSKIVGETENYLQVNKL